MKRLSLILAIATVAVLFTQRSDAAMILRLTSSQGGSVTITDGGLGDSSGTAGVIVFNGAITGWTVNVTTGIGTPPLGGPNAALLDLNSVNAGSAGGTLTIELTQTGLSLLGPLPTAVATLAIGGTTAGTLGYSAFLDNADGAFAQAISLGSLGTFLTGPFSGSSISGVGYTNPFSLTQVVTITHVNGAFVATSFNADLSVITPEPTSLALLATGLPFIGVFWRRRRKQHQAAA